MKRVVWFSSLVLLFCALFVAPAAAQGTTSAATPSLYIDETKLKVAPLLDEGALYIPIRAAMEYMGAKVGYNGRSLTVKRGDTIIGMQPGKTSITINGETIAGTASPIVARGSTYVPVRLFGNALGYEVEYRAAANRVTLRTPGNHAVIYGYAKDLDGTPVKQGAVLLEDAASSKTIEAPIRSGFYRFSAAPGSYRFAGYRNDADGVTKKADQPDAFDVTAGQTVFRSLAPAKEGFKITLHDANGAAINYATLSFNSETGPVSIAIRGGVGYLDFSKPGTYMLDKALIKDEASKGYDIYQPFTIRSDGTATSLDVSAYPPNVVLRVAAQASTVYGGISIRTVNENYVATPDSVYSGMEGTGTTFAFYLPDGAYEWTSYFDASTYQHFDDVQLPFTVKNGKAQDDLLTWKKPANTIHGTASTSAGTPLSGGYITFEGNGNEYSVYVRDGKFDCYVPDGTYTVQYEQVQNEQYTVQLSGAVTLADGKLAGSPKFVFTRS